MSTAAIGIVNLAITVPLRIFLEAAGGFEPPYYGFADRRLTTWLSRPCPGHIVRQHRAQCQPELCGGFAILEVFGLVPGRGMVPLTPNSLPHNTRWRQNCRHGYGKACLPRY